MHNVIFSLKLRLELFNFYSKRRTSRDGKHEAPFCLRMMDLTEEILFRIFYTRRNRSISTVIYEYPIRKRVKV